MEAEGDSKLKDGEQKYDESGTEESQPLMEAVDATDQVLPNNQKITQEEPQGM